jgi:hypothetical protein
MQQRMRGINLGGWLMMEGYMLGGRNIPESVFKANLAKLFGPDFVNEFTQSFRANFIQDSDFKTIQKLGFNCVRLPFNYHLLEEPNGFAYLKQCVETIGKNQLYVILDMHAVPGCQNQDWHSDSTGAARFWEKEEYRRQYFDLWEKLAEIFKGEKWVAGYDIMNEAVTENIDLLREVYQKTVEIIRGSGNQHTIFLEGNKWAREVDFLEGIKGENLAVSIHFYEPLEFTFNWHPDTVYPGEISGVRWDRQELRKRLKKYADFAQKMGRPGYVGEFGIASRCSHCGAEFRWAEDIISIFEEFGFQWTYWTYKSVRGLDVPDGLFQLSDRSGLVGIKSIVSGMENFYTVLKNRKEEFFRLWRTENFKMNRFLFDRLRPYLKG